MINTGGSDFRTLAQPIFVNGQRVKEVWADGHMVYPEAPGGNYLKVHGFLYISKSYTRRQVSELWEKSIPATTYLIEGENTYIPAWSSHYAVSVEFVAIYKAKTMTLRVSDYWFPITSPKYSGKNYYGTLNPLAPDSDEDDSGHIDETYGKRIDGPFTVQAFECRVRSNPIPIIPRYVEEAKGGGFIHDSSDSYTRVETIPNMPEILEATYWNGEHLTQLNYGYEHPLNTGMGLRIASHDMGGISLNLYGIKVSATKNYYGGSYFYPDYYGFKRSQPMVLEIGSVGTLRVPITDILYSGASQNSAPEWAQTILPDDFQYL